MDVDFGKLSVANNEPAGRFETTVAGQTAFVKYRRAGNRLIIIHTEVPSQLSGHGIAAKLTQAALEFARSGGFKVVPFCPYVSGYIRKHREYHDLLSEEDRQDLLSK
jgi:predicted GNAT family acetyltransferase